MAWGIVTTILPAVDTRSMPVWHTVAFLYTAGLVFSRTAFFDIVAIQGDRIAGRETLPILLGEKKSFVLIRWVLTGVMVLLAGAWLTGLPMALFFPLALVPALMLGLVLFFEKKTYTAGSQIEFLIESCFLITGMMAAIF
jgi:4-hydroxy-3-methylbut-2-enyl diphosphate reductase